MHIIHAGKNAGSDRKLYRQLETKYAEDVNQFNQATQLKSPEKSHSLHPADISNHEDYDTEADSERSGPAARNDDKSVPVESRKRRTSNPTLRTPVSPGQHPDQSPSLNSRKYATSPDFGVLSDSPFGPLDHPSSRKTLFYLISTLNASYPDYDFR